MRNQYQSNLMWSIIVIALLCFAPSAGAVPLESWDDKIPNATQRFKLLTEFGGAAVLDKETQLVWEQSPFPMPLSWGQASDSCINKAVGARRGWRLPSVVELMSLLDPTIQITPALPTGHPFMLDPMGSVYWSASSNVQSPTTLAWSVSLSSGGGASISNKTSVFHFWCVRSGTSAEQY